jgi:hypothetical protein
MYLYGQSAAEMKELIANLKKTRMVGQVHY